MENFPADINARFFPSYIVVDISTISIRFDNGVRDEQINHKMVIFIHLPSQQKNTGHWLTIFKFQTPEALSIPFKQ